jgi:exopolyphosphatase/guanosine-5'-triphosphate,3'-diphosphate pyrophosphatase
MSLNKNEIVAAIDIGSNSIRMKIVEVKNNGKIVPLEDLRRSVNLGRDSFSYKNIGTETTKKTCDILNDFNKLLKEYKIKTVRAVATSAVREAENNEYVLDQIKTKTGIAVEIINNAQERFFTYKAIRDRIEDYQGLRKEGALMVDIGPGGVEASVYKDGYLNLTENIKVGSLRLREILCDLERKTLDFAEIMEKFVDNKIYLLKREIKEKQLKNMVGLGGELKVIAYLCGYKTNEPVKVKKKDMDKLYDALKSMSTQSLAQKYGIAADRAEMLLPSVIVFNEFLELVDSDYIIAPLVSLRDGLIADIADNRLDLQRKLDFQEDIIHLVRHLGERYNYDQQHSASVEALALKIFNDTKRIHGLKENEELYLQIAAILHDVGKFISLNEHPVNSYNIILQSNIIGLSSKELQIIANVAKYHSEENPSLHDESYRSLGHKDRIIVSKLSAILKLADSLDISHRQHVKDIEISFDNDMLVKLNSAEDITLEQWVFENKSDFFHEVLGIRPIIKKRGR